MPAVPFVKLLDHAKRNAYAVGYFESWNLESLLAVADAAEAKRSPVILGFSGITLPCEERIVKDRLSVYAALGRDVCSRLSVPACLLFNESANLSWVLEAAAMGFNAVMFTDERLTLKRQTETVRNVAEAAHAKGVAVEGELTPLPGAGGEAVGLRVRETKTDLRKALTFIKETKIDAFAVEIGQAHRHGKVKISLDLDHLRLLAENLPVPLVLHGASSVTSESLAACVACGIAKINVGSNLKRVFFNALRDACLAADEDFNPYDIIGSGLKEDVLVRGRIAMRKMVEDLMDLFGSSGQAGKPG